MSGFSSAQHAFFVSMKRRVNRGQYTADSPIIFTNCRKLYNDGDYRFSLLIGCDCFLGLRISDLRILTWDMIMDRESLMLREHKTGKRRIIKTNRGFQKHIRDCYNALQITNRQQPCFISNKGGVYSIQRINFRFKEIRIRYKLPIQNFSTPSLRKTFGRKVVESAGKDAEMALISLSELFNHSSVQVSRRHLGLRQEELLGVYDALDF